VQQLVSILIPAYNAEKWIQETLRSAVNQTWPRKEIILVDDGSSDHTLAIAHQFDTPLLKVIAQENRGASAARNRALAHAQGDHIQWLDADDLLAPDKIEQQMKEAGRGKDSMTLLSSPQGTFYWRWEKARFAPHALWQDLTPIEYLLAYFSENIWFSPAAWLVSRRLTEQAGPWDERLSLNDDGEYFCRVVAKCEHITFVPTARCYYRRSGFSQLSRATGNRAAASLLLSLTLSIGHLRSLEDSARTRSAALIAVQESLSSFRPEQTDLREMIDRLAFDLGGRLRPPQHGWKVELLQALFGKQQGMAALHLLRKMKLTTAIRWDELLYRISRTPGACRKGICNHR